MRDAAAPLSPATAHQKLALVRQFTALPPERQAWVIRLVEAMSLPRCRICACTDAEALASGCVWVEPGLCSACADVDAIDVADDPAPVTVREDVVLYTAGNTALATVDPLHERADDHARDLTRRLAACLNACEGLPTAVLEVLAGQQRDTGAGKAVCNHG